MRILFGLLAAFLVASPALANEITAIDVTGNVRVEDSTVLSYIGFDAGDTYQPAMASNVVKTLYATGLFSDVKVNYAGGTVTIQVAENPLVNRVVFEGNDKIVDDRLEEFVQLKPRTIFTPAKAQRDVQEIQAAYRARGFYMLEVEPQIIRRDQNRVDVVFKMNEGEKTKVRSIRFVGNDRFSDGDLRSVVRTKESRFWRFLTTSDSYDPDRIELDKELLRRFYVKAGHADFRVVSAVTELSADRRSFFVTYTVDEGPIYDFGTIDVALADREVKVDQEALAAQLTLRQGQRYDGSRVDENIEYLYDYLGSQGFAFLTVTPQFDKDMEGRTVDVNFVIRPGPRVYVNRIEVAGNTRTKDHVLRRELRFAEGDAFSSDKLQRSRDRLNLLGYFSAVEIEQVETAAPDRVDLIVDVDEQSTGEFSVGAGFSTFEGALATAQLRERNFLGRGQSVNLAFAISGRRQDFNFSFTEPYFMGRDLSAGLDLFNTRRDFQTEASYDLANNGFALRFGVPLSEFWRYSTRVGFKETKIENVASDASTFVRDDEGKRNSLHIAQTITVDKRDNRLVPTRGYRASATLDYSGFGTDTEYLRGLVEAAWYHSLADDWTLSVGGRAGVINGLGSTLPLYEYFQISGNDFRGFDTYGIGPRDATNDDALGGRYMLGNNVELTFPIPGGQELGIRGVVFTDGGIITDFDRGNSATVLSSDLYRVSVGGGIHWETPFGPLRLELGVPVIKADEDESQFFSFNFGARF